MILVHYNYNYGKGVALFTLIVILSAFSVIFLTLNQWLSYQRKTGIEIYQRYQAIQIAETQKQRLFLGLPCEQKVIQNQLSFRIQCANHQVKIYCLAGKNSIEL